MTPEELEIARAFVACGRWVWLPGMRAGHVFADSPGGLWWDRLYGEPGSLVGAAQGLEVHPSGTYPNPTTHVAVDHTDPCTRGGILQVVRDATGRKHAYLEYVGGYWAMVDPMDDRWPLYWTHACASEAEALLLALQAAPEAS